MATQADYRTRVGYILGYNIGTSSSPTSTEVDQWIIDGANLIKKYAAPENLDRLLESTSIAMGGSGVYTGSLPSDFLRDVYVYDSSNDPLDKVTPHEVGYLVRSNNTYHNSTKVYAIIGSAIASGQYGSLILTYLSYDEAGDIANIPIEYEELLVDYGVLQARRQEDNFQQYLPLFQKWVAEIKNV